MVLTAEKETLKEQLIALGETWNSTWEAVLEASMPYFRAYLKLRSIPIQNRKIPRKLQELILLACDASCTHLFLPGIQAHTQKAVEAGASREEILEVLQQTSVLGIHAISIGLPILFEVLEETGKITREEINKPHDERRAQLKATFQKQRGFWSPHYNDLLLIDPDFFEAYTAYSSVPFISGGHLNSRDKEFIYIAIDCASTHLYAPGLKTHVRNAIRYGASAEEILEVYELAALMGAQTMLLGVPALNEVLAK